MTTCSAVAFLFVLVTVVGNLVSRKRYRALANERAGESFDSFRAAFAEDCPINVLWSVYVQIQRWTCVSEFPVRPDDDLETVFGIDEELEDELWYILKRCDRKLPDRLPAHVPIATVRDLVAFVITCPEVSGLDSHSG